MNKIWFGYFLLALSTHNAVGAGYCDLIGNFIYAQDKGKGLMGTYLGVISDNQFLQESISNEFGTYGSEFSTKSIFNTFGTFGSEFSSYSPFNSFTSSPPIIWSYNSITKQYSAVAYLSKNTFLGGATADPTILIATMKSTTCGGVYVPPVITLPDLVIDSLKLFISKNKDSVYVTYIVANIGTVQSPPFSVSITISQVNIGPNNFSILAPNKYFSSGFSTKIISDTTTLVIIADIEDKVKEADETNNFAEGKYLTKVPASTIIKNPFQAKPYQVNLEFDILGRSSMRKITSSLKYFLK